MAMRESIMQGKICMVTGANSGIGYYIAKGLAMKGASVVLVCRSPERGQPALESLRAETGNESVELICGDFTRLEEVRGVAEQFRQKHGQLHVLVNNAGVSHHLRRITPNGFEETFQVNHLAPFVLTTSLLDELKAGAPSRIITTSSSLHYSQGVSWNNIPRYDNGFNNMSVYGQSKTANVLFTKELAKRLIGTGVSCYVFAPGFVDTALFRNNNWFIKGVMSVLRLFAMRTPEQGADTAVWLAVAPEVAEETGLYYMDRAAKEPSGFSLDPANAVKLWDMTEDMIAGLNLDNHHMES